MSKHDIESAGSNPRDHAHPKRHYFKHAHKDWRVWVALALMLTAMAVYVLSEDEAVRPGNPDAQKMPAIAAP
jgi:hypothetical protein